MLIFGWGHRTFKKYGVLKRYCTHCQRTETELELIKVTIWLTIFFIPVLPTSRRYLLMCRACKGIEEVNKETFFQYIENQTEPKGNNHQPPGDKWHGNKTETQINYLKEIEAYKREKEAKVDLTDNEMALTRTESLIRQSAFPITKDYLVNELQTLGVTNGMTVLVHTSLSSLGWVCGGPVTVIQGLQEVVGEKGTIIMPTHSGDYSDPTQWENPPVPKQWHELIKQRMPAFDPRITPTYSIGTIPELFRNMPGVVRSQHPHYSFAAWGEQKEYLTKEHPLDYGLSKTSPLGKLYHTNGYVLLLGASFDSNTSFHLAEYIQVNVKEVKRSAPILEDGHRVWKDFKDIEFDCEDFGQIGEDFEKTGKVIKAKVGLAECRLFLVKDVVDFAQEWMLENRDNKML